jgi:Fe-S oxidoreductase
MLEAKAANVAEHGLDRSDWVMARLGLFTSLGSTASLLANRLLRGPLTRWFLEKVFGVSRRRRLPPFSRRSFLRLARQWNWTRPPAANGAPRVALFVDIFANYHDPSIAEAAVRVLQHNGVAVFVPPAQTSCGMEALAQGDVETARELARRNHRVFAELVRDGYLIACTEPTAALALAQDYLHLIDDPDIRQMARATVELTALLADRHAAGRLRTDFHFLPLTLGHHVPCHLKALGRAAAAPAILRLIPGLRVVEIDAGCSGMAGTFGLRAEHYDTSLAAGRELFAELRRPRIQFGTTECSSCRLQMEEGAGKRTLHPVQYLALAYGLMPELAKRLTAPVGGLVAP